MKKISRVELDIAKPVFQVYAISDTGDVVVSQELTLA